MGLKVKDEKGLMPGHANKTASFLDAVCVLLHFPPEVFMHLCVLGDLWCMEGQHIAVFLMLKIITDSLKNKEQRKHENRGRIINVYVCGVLQRLLSKSTSMQQKQSFHHHQRDGPT